MLIPDQKPASFRSVLICFLWITSYGIAYGQEGISLSKPRLHFDNNKLIIEYSILNENPDARFNVDLRITDSTGTMIKAKSLSGDIGDSIPAGKDKTIIWNLAADQIVINMGVYVEVKAEKVKVPAVVPVGKKEEAMAVTQPEKNKVAEEKKTPKEDVALNKPATDSTAKGTEKTAPLTEKNTETTHSTGIAKNLLLSAVVPGWGLTRLSDGKPWWLLAVADAGCVAAAIVYNHKASVSYSNYLGSNVADEFDPYFEDASAQHTVSKVFGWSAVGIWVADMFAVGIQAIRAGKSSDPGVTGQVSMGSWYDMNTSSACMSIQFNF